MDVQVGQHFILGFHGYRVPAWLKDFEAEYGLGGVILFDYHMPSKKYENNIESPEQVRELCSAIHALDSKPLIFIDQEGGKVCRLKEEKGFAFYPSAWEFNQLELSKKKALTKKCFEELKSLGIDFNLAPVIDLALNEKNTDIFTVNRSYSKKESEVIVNVNLLQSIAKDCGLGLCLKHFPGIGAAATNSHDEILDLSSSITKEQEELFYTLAPKLPGNAILLSHGIVRSWDGDIPISLSPKVLKRIRNKVSDAFLITDDLQMQGMQKIFKTSVAVLSSIRAGIDCVIIGNNMMDEEKDCYSFAKELKKAVLEDEEIYRLSAFSRVRIHRRKTLY